MKTPRHRIWLIALAAVLGLTSGHRALDLAGIGTLTDEAAHWDSGSVIGAAIMPFFAIPFLTLLCIIVLRNYPPHSIGLFYWAKGSTAKQVLWSLFFGLLSLGSVLWAAQFGIGIVRLLQQSELGYATDSGLNLIASLGGIYLWLCFRAIACYPRQAKTETAGH